MTTIQVSSWREIDALFAEKVLGWNANTVHARSWILRSYSNSIDAAMEGVWKVTKPDKGFSLHYWPWDTQCPYAAEIKEPNGQVHWGHDKVPARAVVLACLRAVGVEPFGKEIDHG